MFDRVFVLNLDRRPERLAQFQANLPTDWTFPKPERFTGVDSQAVRPPEWWNQTPGAWGCLRAHMAILDHCLNSGIQSALVFEDDAVFRQDFSRHALEFIDALPADWEMLYLGGMCRKFLPDQMPPEQVNERVVRIKSATGTWAYGYRGTQFMYRLWREVHERLFSAHRHHIDIMLCHLHERYKVYAPHRWLVGHPAGISDVRGKGDKVYDELNLPDPITLCPALVVTTEH